MIRERISEETKAAMKGGDKARLSTLRMVASGKGEVNDESLLPLLQKLVKQRQESAELYDKGARPELAASERAEIAVILSFLPQQMSEDETRAAIAAAIKETGAASAKDMGKVMAALKAKHAGKMDFAKASGAVKGMLG